MSSNPTTSTTVQKHDFDSTSFLTIYNGHNGDMTKIPKPIRYHTLQDFKGFICESFTNYLIDGPDTIFLLTSFGIRLNFNIINEINDVYVFDKRIFNDNKSLVERYFQSNIGNYHNLLIEFDQLHQNDILPSSGGSIRQMSTNIKRFEPWSGNYLHHIRKCGDIISQYLKQINNIFKSLNIIFQFINNFINEVEKSFNSYYNYVKLINLKSLQKHWFNYYQALKKFPIIKFKDTHIALVNLIDHELLESNSRYIEDHLPLILTKFNQMVGNFNDINNDKVAIDKLIEGKRNESIETFKHNNHDHMFSKAKDLVAEITNKIQKNLDNNEVESIYTACQEYQKELLQYGKLSKKLLTRAKDFKYTLLSSSFSILNKISVLQMTVVEIKGDLKMLSQPSSSNDVLSHETITKIKGAEDYLSLTVDLPLLFGFILIEKRRQFEWYDFFAKGVIQNVTEQLMSIMEHEKVFQKLWLKKFGTFLSFLTSNNLLKPQLPNLDITLINNQNQDMFKMLGEFEVERDDVLDYIKVVEQFESKNGTNKFGTLLNKNFKDLIKSTNNMKMVTRLVTSMANLTSPNEDLSNSKLRKMMENDSEYNDNLVKGLKVRIRKLEDLLHQQQFKNISNWPVTRGYNSSGSTPASTPPPTLQKAQTQPQIQTQLQVQEPTTPQKQPGFLNHVSAPILKTSIKSPQPISTNTTNGSINGNGDHTQTSPDLTSPKSNPTSLLRKNTSTPIDASVTIDKHLDNLRLKKENKELVDENNRFRQSNFDKDTEIERLTQQIRQLQSDKQHGEREHHQELQSVERSHKQDIEAIKAQHMKDMEVNGNGFSTQINELKNKHEQKIMDLMTQLKRNETMVQEYKVLNDLKESTVKELSSRNDKNTQEINDLTRLKEDLMSNLASKEEEFKSQINSYEDDLKKANLRLEENAEEYEQLIEVAHQQGHTDVINELNSLVESLMLDIKKSVYVNYDFFIEMVMILESIGLLLVKEWNPESKAEEYKISRVKGLRSKKLEEGDISFVSFDEKPSTKVINDIDESMSWIHDLHKDPLLDSNEVKSLSTSVDGSRDLGDHLDDQDEKNDTAIQKSYELIKTYSTYFKEDNDFSKFLKLISFRNAEADKFFLTAISKRFRDVEGFAKKLTKENKTKVQEIHKLTKTAHNKISMNHFSIGDLALFLPTRIEHSTKVKINYQPWAAFNIGAPHYFLNTFHDSTNHLNNKEWLVAKITGLEEFKVNDENVDDEEKNPFKLSVGITWFLVEAKEESIS